jgi:hypothetical protein
LSFDPAGITNGVGTICDRFTGILIGEPAGTEPSEHRTGTLIVPVMFTVTGAAFFSESPK